MSKPFEIATVVSDVKGAGVLLETESGLIASEKISIEGDLTNTSHLCSIDGGNVTFDAQSPLMDGTII